MRALRSALLCLALLALFGRAAGADEVVPGRLIVRLRTPKATVRIGARPARVLRRVGRAQLIAIPGAGAAELRALAQQLAASPEVLWAEPDRVRHRMAASVEPDDPRYAEQWALPMIRAPQAWSRSTGSPDVTVAVLDSGVLPHPDLAARLAPGYDFISDAASGGDGDGRDADPTDTGDSSESSSALHGLHIAGILGAVTNNGVGVAGIDWSCRVEPVRVLGVQGGTGVDSDIADAIRWAAGLHVDGVPDNPEPAQVINLSFGGAGQSQAMQEAVTDAIAAGASVVAAAGNAGIDAATDSPAGLAGVITVGAVTRGGQRASYSNYGPKVALMAPGGELTPEAGTTPDAILSTMKLPGIGFTYAYLAGTSQAAPFVSGTLALMKALYPAMSPAEGEKLLQLSADASARCADPDAPDDPSRQGCGAGLLDVDAALALASAAADCAPACGDGLLCSAGQCVSAASLGGPQPGGNLTLGGCSQAGGRPDGDAWLVALTLLFASLGASRRRNAARRGCGARVHPL